MKKIFFAILILYSCNSLNAQNDVKVMTIYANGGCIFRVQYDSIDSIIIAKQYMNSSNMEDYLSARALLPEKKLNGLFSVSPTKQVRFSSGNLQYNAYSDLWRFALNQYDIVGDSIYGNVYHSGKKCDNNEASSTYDGWIDLFASWTSGFDNTTEDSLAIRFHPWDRDTSVIKVGNLLHDDYYGYGCSYSDNIDVRFSFVDSVRNCKSKYANYDWGIYNSISNGGNKPGLWRTLATDEWHYLLYERKFKWNRVYAKIDKIFGLVLLPDDWTENDDIKNFSAQRFMNYLTPEEWLELENYGAVFLPCKSPDYGNYMSIDNLSIVEILPSMAVVIGLLFNDAVLPPYMLNSVRLVQDAE